MAHALMPHAHCLLTPCRMTSRHLSVLRAYLDDTPLTSSSPRRESPRESPVVPDPAKARAPFRHYVRDPESLRVARPRGLPWRLAHGLARAHVRHFQECPRAGSALPWRLEYGSAWPAGPLPLRLANGSAWPARAVCFRSASGSAWPARARSQMPLKNSTSCRQALHRMLSNITTRARHNTLALPLLRWIHLVHHNDASLNLVSSARTCGCRCCTANMQHVHRRGDHDEGGEQKVAARASRSSRPSRSVRTW